MTAGRAVALASAVLFGMSTPLAKLLAGSVPPLMLAGLLYAGSGTGLALLLAARRLRRASQPSIVLPPRADWPWWAGAILSGGVVGPVLLMLGLATTSASTASLLLNLEAVLSATLAWFVFRENFDRRVVLGMLAIVAGGLLVAWTPAGGGSTPLGVVFIAGACLCWAIDNNLTRRISGSDAMLVAGVKGLVAGAANLGLALLVGDAWPPLRIVGAAMAVGLLGYGASLALFVVALRHLGAARAGAYFSVAPFFGAGLAIALGDPWTWQVQAGGALMAVGVWLHLTEHHEHRHRHEPQVHEHWHAHDEHHRHGHDAPFAGGRHSHVHAHDDVEHTHAHAPDVHHRHPH